MFFRSEEIEEDLKCAYCKQKFIDVVKLIPSCGESICGHCYKDLKEYLDSNGEFKCKLCKKSHMMPEDGLPVNMSLSRMLKRKKVEKPLSEEAKTLRRAVESLPSQLRELKSFDDRDYIHEYCDQLEVEIIEEINSLVKLLNDIQENLLKQTREYRIQCLDSLSLRTSSQGENEGLDQIKQELQQLSKEFDEFSQQWNEFFNQLEVFASESDVSSALSNTKRYEERMNALNVMLKRNALNWQVMSFKSNHSFLGDPSILEKLLCLSIQDHKKIETKIVPIALRTLTGHTDEIFKVIFLSDDKLASCSEDTTIKVWNVQDGALLYELVGHTVSVNSVAILTNGWLASCSSDMSVKIWDLVQKRLIRTLKDHKKPVVSLHALKNGNLASYALDDTIRIWNPFASENNLLLTITGHGNSFWHIPFGVLSNENLLTFSRDEHDKEECIFRVWNPINGLLVKTVLTGLSQINALLVLLNDQVVIGLANGTLEVIDLADESKSFTKSKAHEHLVTVLAQLSNGNLVSAASDDNGQDSFVLTIKIWSLPELNLLQTVITDHSENIHALCISSNNMLIATGSGDKTIKLWSLN